MKRIILMVVTNLFFVIVCWPKLCRMAAHPERYTKEERWKHLQFWVERACKGGRIVLEAHGQEKLPEEPFILYPNHQGMFDVLAIAGTCDHFLGVVNKKEVRNFLLLKQVFQITGSLSIPSTGLSRPWHRPVSGWNRRAGKRVNMWSTASGCPKSRPIVSRSLPGMQAIPWRQNADFIVPWQQCQGLFYGGFPDCFT